MGRRIKFAAAVVVVLIATPAGRWMRRTRPWETPIESAYRVCGECGLATAEVDGLIREVRGGELGREQAIKLWVRTYDDPARLEQARELCGGCVDAVLDAAGLMENG